MVTYWLLRVETFFFGKYKFYKSKFEKAYISLKKKSLISLDKNALQVF